MPKHIFLSRECAPEFKAEKDRLTLPIGAIANGDFKLNPFLICHSKNSRAMKALIKYRSAFGSTF